MVTEETVDTFVFPLLVKHGFTYVIQDQVNSGERKQYQKKRIKKATTERQTDISLDSFCTQEQGT